MKTKAVSEAVEYMSLNKALQYCGVSKCAWHYTKKFKVIPIDASVTYKVRQIASRRPTYGTRRIAADLPRDRHVHQPQENTADISENRLERATKDEK